MWNYMHVLAVELRIAFAGSPDEINLNDSKRTIGITTMDQSIMDPIIRKKPISARVDGDALTTAERMIASCEACDPEVSEVLFDEILDSITGCDPGITDYQLSGPVNCPSCQRQIQSGTWRWDESHGDEGPLFILPGTLVALKM